MDGSKARCSWQVELGLCNIIKIKKILHKTPLNSLKPSCINSQSKIVIAKGDSAATHHYWRERDKDMLSNIKLLQYCNITLSNATTISSLVSDQLLLPSQLLSKAKDVIVVLQLKSLLLISLGQLCDDNCNIHLNKKDSKVYKSSWIIIQGYRNPNDRL